MEQKLTEEEIAKLLFMYLGCNYQIEYVSITTQGDVVGQGDNLSVFDIYMYKGGDGNDTHHTVKPIIKPLSSISDEDAIQVAKILLPLPFVRHKKGWVVKRNEAITGFTYISVYNPKNVYKVEIDITCLSFNIYNMDECVTGQCETYPTLITQFLTSKRYAVPLWFGIDHWANSKTAIDLGIAIDSTLNQ